VDNLVDAPRRNSYGDGQAMLRDAQGLKVLLHQYLARMDRGHGCGSGHGFPLSVVIDQLNIFCARVGPFETDPPLLVDPDAVRADAVALQLLESIARGDPQVAENLGSVEDQQLPEGNPLGAVVKFGGLVASSRSARSPGLGTTGSHQG
jgi:hypothetical protein